MDNPLVHIFNTTNHHIMLTLGILFAGYAIAQLFWGTLSDKIGRKPALLAAVGLYFFSILTVVYTHNIVSFSVLLFISGFMAAAFTGIGNAIVKDIYGKPHIGKIIAYIEIAMAIAPTIAPAIGAHLAHWFNWQAIFIFLACYAVILFSLTLVFTPETHIKQTRMQTFSEKFSIVYCYLLSNGNFLAYILVLGVLFGVFFAYLDSAPFIFIQYLGVSTTLFGWLFFFSSCSYAIGAIFVSKLIVRLGCYKLVGWGITISLLGSITIFIIALTKTTAISWIVGSFIISMFGFGLCLPACKDGAMMVFNKHHGSAASLMKFSQTSLCVVLLFVISQLQTTDSLLPLASLALVASMIAILIFIFVNRIGKIKTSNKV